MIAEQVQGFLDKADWLDIPHSYFRTGYRTETPLVMLMEE